MATLEITKDNFDDVVGANDIVILDFWASWCGPCRAFAPVFEAASETHDDIVFGKIDTEAQRELAAAFGIRSIPTLAVYREKIPIFMQPGALRGPDFEQLITQVRGLDMDDVRATIAQREAEQPSA